MSLLTGRPPPASLPLATQKKFCTGLSLAASVAHPQTSLSAATCYATFCFSSSITLTQAILLSLAVLMRVVYFLHQPLTNTASAPSSPCGAGEKPGSAVSKLEGHRSAEWPWRTRDVKSRMFCIHRTVSPFTASVNWVCHLIKYIPESCVCNPLCKLKLYLSLAMKLKITEEKVERKKPPEYLHTINNLSVCFSLICVSV